MPSATLILAAAALLQGPTTQDLLDSWYDTLLPMLAVDGAMRHCAQVDLIKVSSTDDPLVVNVDYGFGRAVLRFEAERWIWQSGDKPPCDVMIMRSSEG